LTKIKKETACLVFKVDSKMLNRIDDFRHVNRLQFRSLAVQYLLEFALNNPALKDFVKEKKENKNV